MPSSSRSRVGSAGDPRRANHHALSRRVRATVRAPALGRRRRRGTQVDAPQLEHPADVGALGGALARRGRGPPPGSGGPASTPATPDPAGMTHAAGRVGRRREDPRRELGRGGRRLGGGRRPVRRIRLRRRLGHRRGRRRLRARGRCALGRRGRGRQGLGGRGGRGRLDDRHDGGVVGPGEPGRAAEAHRRGDRADRQQAGALAGAAHDACRARLTALS